MKREILKKFKNQKLSERKFCAENNIEYTAFRSFKAYSQDLLHLCSEDPMLEEFYNREAVSKKTTDINNYIEQSIIRLRKEGMTVQINNIEQLANDYIKDRELDWKCSEHFLRFFKQRKKLAYKKIHGESKSADRSKIPEWFLEFNKLREEYSDHNIYNFDETVVYIKTPSTRSYVLKDDKCKGIKEEKSRITVGIGFNFVGDELAPMIISKSKNSRAFKKNNINILNLLYFSNDSAWCDSRIFKSYLCRLNECFKIEDRKILLIVDNFSGHMIPNMSHIRIFLLPPNATSIMQPMDLGVINVFKKNYKSYLASFLNRCILQDDLSYKDALKKITLFEVCTWIRQSCDSIKDSTITNAFKKFIQLDPNYIHQVECDSESNVIDDDNHENPFDDSTDSIVEEKELVCIEEICCADEEVLGINDTLYYLNKLEDAFKIDPTLLKDFMDLKLRLLDTFKDRRHHR